jgi:hypothetical protein
MVFRPVFAGEQIQDTIAIWEWMEDELNSL